MHLEAIERQPGILTEMDMPSGFRMAGWVYILSNENMPGIFKVGMTTTSPEIRAKEISSATGVPYPFKVEAAFHCEDPAYSEKELHDALSDFRINDSREFFEVSLEELKLFCSEYCEAEVGEKVESMAIRFNVISFESLSNLNISNLFDDIGLSVFGDKLAVAERLIRLGAELVTKKLNNNYVSIVFDENKAYAIEDEYSSGYRKSLEEQERLTKEQVASGIYGPQQPSKDSPIPF